MVMYSARIGPDRLATILFHFCGSQTIVSFLTRLHRLLRLPTPHLALLYAIAWWLTVVQFGCLGLRLADRWPAWAAIGVATALGMTLPPWYEGLAAPGRAWYYPSHGVMLSHTPLWIIFTYGGCMFAIAAPGRLTIY